jgi:hypothetical protein
MSEDNERCNWLGDYVSVITEFNDDPLEVEDMGL